MLVYGVLAVADVYLLQKFARVGGAPPEGKRDDKPNVNNLDNLLAVVIVKRALAGNSLRCGTSARTFWMLCWGGLG